MEQDTYNIIIISVIALIFSVIVFGIASIKREHDPTNSKSSKGFLGLTRGTNAVWQICTVVIGLIISSVALWVHFYDPTNLNKDDFPNWFTLVMEISIGFIITIIVNYRTGKSEDQSNLTLGKIEKIVEDEAKIRVNRIERAKKGILFGLDKLLKHLNDIKTGIRETHAEELTIKPLTGFSDFDKNHARYVINSIILYHCDDAHYFLEQEFETEVRSICSEISTIYMSSDDKDYEIERCDELIQRINDVKNKFLKNISSYTGK